MTFRWGSEEYFVINNILTCKGYEALLQREGWDGVSDPMDLPALIDHLLQIWIQPKQVVLSGLPWRTGTRRVDLTKVRMAYSFWFFLPLLF